MNETLEKIFNNIENSAKGAESEGNFAGLFDDIDVNSNKLGSTVAKRNNKLEKILSGIANIKLDDYKSNSIDAFGDAYEFLMSMYASNAGKSGGEFFTPQEVSELLTRLAVVGKESVNKVYDPACGSGSLLLKSAKILGKENVRNGFYGQWADGNNKIIPDLVDFTRTFFAKHTILNILTKYCVFTSENMLLVMRPYQIVATEKILNRIEVSTNYKKMGTIEAGGYIWHATGSGKTLTSFKTAQLTTELDYVDKVLFIVDRKDLDYQTMKEYDKFQKGAANGNRSTKILKKQLEDDKSRIIVTTIQKLNEFVKKNKNHPVYQKHMVLIFDECHRSQFGDMHQIIVNNFKNYHLFGFTGTPIFAKNAGNKSNPNLCTTEQAFGEKLHIQ